MKNAITGSTTAGIVCLALSLSLAEAQVEDASRIPVVTGRAAMIYKPNITYPLEAKEASMTGSGIAVLDINPATGQVIGVRMGKSTGHAILDRAAIDAFWTARFAIGTRRQIKIPITFTLSGGRISYERKRKNMDDVLARFLGKGTVLKGPIPEYPTFRDWTFKSGKGVYELHANSDGNVDAVKVLKTSGDDTFDREAVKTLRKWRLRRGPLILELPLHFTLTPTDFHVGVAR